MSARPGSRPLALAFVLGALAACGSGHDEGGPDVPVPGHAGALKTSAVLRAGRRAYDGAPPVIPHAEMPGDCVACHDELGLAIDGVGFSPPCPHEGTRGLSLLSRCTQCHVYRRTESLFVASTFVGLPQDLRRGTRAHDEAPPVIPHETFLRGNCSACHDGPAAREEIRTPHPERESCRQCHVERVVTTAFAR